MPTCRRPRLTSTSRTSARGCGSPRLSLPQPVLAWLAVHGRPIRYSYVRHPWPISAYQNVYATEPGSAEMPSAGRPFTPEVITRLVADGHRRRPARAAHRRRLAGVHRAALPGAAAGAGGHGRAGERHPPARRPGDRRRHHGGAGLESAGPDGVVEPFDGWTDVVITPERGVRVVDGLLTGWHEPEASHLLMLEAIAGRELLERSYAGEPRRALPVARVRRRAPDPAVGAADADGATLLSATGASSARCRRRRGSRAARCGRRVRAARWSRRGSGSSATTSSRRSASVGARHRATRRSASSAIVSSWRTRLRSRRTSCSANQPGWRCVSRSAMGRPRPGRSSNSPRAMAAAICCSTKLSR